MIEVTTNTDAFASSLAQLQRRMSNLKPVMQSIGAEMESRVANRFETRSDPDGKSWAEWSPFTLATYPEGGRRKLLERYGDMLSSLNWKATSDSVRIGFGVDYATYHEFGTETMPRRGLLFSDPDNGELGAADEQAIDELLQDWIDGVFD